MIHSIRERSSFFDKRKELNDFFLKKLKNVYSKKIPSSKKYPFSIHDPYSVLDENSGYEKLYLVGDNWLEDKDKKPIAIMVGFNDWKLGFISDYLTQYRTAFTKRKLGNIDGYMTLNFKDEQPSFFIVWGYNECFYINIYTKKHNIPLYRMEDGFVRSSLLGASHATPYSLILDKKGLYYNPKVESDIECILNTYNFKNNQKLLKESKKALNLLVELKISKYNQPNISQVDSLGIKIKKRVVILGQVDGDAAIRYGNPEKWSAEELVKLARYENPEADVYYRPHPEVYKGYQKTKFNRKRVEYFAKIVSPEEPLLDFLESIDHVYTINSLSGLEALLRGKKVTVVGAAFYAGWGLTDDRVEMDRRERKLSLIELFAGIYLKYPMYLADLNNSYIGIQAASYRINSDKYVETFNSYQKKFEEKDFSLLSKSDYWAYLLFHNKDYLSIKEEKELISSANFKKYFEGNDSILFQIILLYFIFGSLQNESSRDFFIRKVRIYIDDKVFNQFLLDIMEYYPGNYIVKHFSFLLKENNELYYASNLVKHHLEQSNESRSTNHTLKLCYEDTNKLTLCSEENHQKEDASPFENFDIENMREALENYKEALEYEKFLQITKQLLISNNANTMLFTRAAEMAILKMDNNSAVKISQFLQKINIFAHNNVAVHMELESFNFDTSKESFEYITKLFTLQLTLTPDRINRSWAILKNYFISNEYYELFSARLNLYNKKNHQKAITYLELNKPTEALKILRYMLETNDKSHKLSVEYSKTLSILGKHDEAEKIIKEAIKDESTHANYTEYLRQLKARGKFKEALIVVEDGLNKKIKLTYEGHIMPIYFGLGQIEEGFKCFHNSSLKEKLIRAFGEKKYRETHDMTDIKNLLLIFSSGPAEEMRFASMYDEISSAIGTDNFKLTCDYRLEKLLSRSFPKINFVPVKRTRFFTPEYPIENYNELPSSQLSNALDNDSLIELKASSEIKLVSELFFNFRKEYKDFINQGDYLKVDKKQINYFKDKLPQDSILIGISWRSFLTNAMRNVHYLSIEELKPIFMIPNVRFVNLQYDECQHDLDIIKNEYQIDIIDFPELDQMNDFDGVAGLMKNLDLVISPFTAVIELAGSIGVKGILFSNHGESHWRKDNKSDIDIWYKCVKIVGSGQYGDKKSLVTDIKNEILNNFIMKEKHV